MIQKKFEYIFGPVFSWRLGVSLGIDPLSTDLKTCNFDCSYCQLGPTVNHSNERKIFVETKDILEELKQAVDEGIDYYTFSGNGEPTLAKNLGDLIDGVKSVKDGKVAVITNSMLINDTSVFNDLLKADFVLAKIDFFNQKTLGQINSPVNDIKYTEIIDGLKKFRREFKGRFALQIMFVDKNLKFVDEIAGIARSVDPDEVQINTPLRESKEKPLDEKTISEVKKSFEGLNVFSVYDVEKKEIKSFDDEQTRLRHGSYKKY